MSNTYTINSSHDGFYEVERPDGVREVMSKKKLNILKKDKGNKFLEKSISEMKVVEEIKIPDVEDNDEDEDKSLGKMNRDELAEIASRYGFEGDLADAAITKKVLIAHIENEKTKR